MLDLNSDKSIYIQIAETIENEILTGNLREGEQAPSTNQFAKVYKINPATAGKGLNILVEEEILYKKRGIGMFVAEGARSKILKKRQAAFFKEKVPKLIREADRLELTVDEIIKVIKEYSGGEK
ncbi:GntR family transcriptional regulator [Clostridium sp. SYSU_GA19001]|uniref:GntR family transcriptional regulator n=1 Tax=Clostridium caldaquaticum TaxID=2940653 RepID=UPI0020774CF7|nr:GntR family transcriptional regulator [Clostridium caldaquaticum]MCM8710288.1 GntR family transcriptional regulator [Clostridium caldaquaticum]